jgi:O-antigen ligase
MASVSTSTWPVSSAARQWVRTRAAVLAAVVAALAVILLFSPIVAAILLGTLAVTVLALRWPVVGLGLMAVAVPWAGGVNLIPPPYPVTLVDILIAAIGVAWITRCLLERRNPLATRIWTPYIFLFLLAMMVSVSQAADWHASLREIVKWAELVVVFIAGSAFIRSKRDVDLLVAAIVLAGVSQALLGYVQFFFGLGPQAFAAHRFALRAFGSFDQPNPYAGFLNMTFPFALTAGILGQDNVERRWYRLAAVVIAGAVLASQSRGALLAGFTAACIVLAVMFGRLRPAFWAGLFVLIAGGWLAALGLIPTAPFQRILNAVGLGNVTFNSVTNANFSAVERAAHWLAGVRMFAAHPMLGVGIGNYSVAYPHYHPRGWYASLEHAHNYLINIAAEAGIVGLTAYILLAGSALWYSCAAIWVSSRRPLRAATLGVLGVLIATNLHNLFDVLYVHGMVAFLGLVMAFVPVAFRMASAPVTELGQGHTA